MKKTFAGMGRRFLAAVLALTMVFSLCGNAFAADTGSETIKYVSFGDSMTNGFGMSEGYDRDENTGDEVYNQGFGNEAEDIYPSMFETYLEGKLGTEIEHLQYAMSAMRAEDLLFTLEYDNSKSDILAQMMSKDNNRLYNDEIWNANFKHGDSWTFGQFVKGRFDNLFADGNYSIAGTEKAAALYQDAMKSADIISLAVGNADFGAFMLDWITDIAGIDGTKGANISLTMDNALVSCDPAVKAQVLALKELADKEVDKALAKYMPGLDAEMQMMLQQMKEVFMYVVVSNCVAYADLLNCIMEMNPDAEIVLVGIMNTFNGVKLVLDEETTIPMDDAFGFIVEPINAYIAGLPAVMQKANPEKFGQAKFYYAEASKVECNISIFQSDIKSEENPTLRNRFITEIIHGDVIWPNVGSMFPGSLAQPTRSQIEAFEAVWEKYMGTAENPVKLPETEEEQKNYEKAFNTALYMAFNPRLVTEGTEDCSAGAVTDMATACAIYLAFEEALTQYSQNSEIPPSTIIALGNLQEVFIPIGAHVDERMEDYWGARSYVLLDTLRKALIEGMTATTEMKGLLHMYARFLIGNGMGCHPSQTGHKELADAVIAAYDSDYTAEDATKEKLTIALDALYELLKEYGPEMADAAYKYAQEQGYIEDIENALKELQSYIEGEVNIYLETEAIPAIKTAIAALEADAEKLNEDLLALKAELDAKLAELEQQLSEAAEGTTAAIEAAIEETKATIAAIETTISETEAALYAVHESIQELHSVLTDLFNAINQLGESVVNVGTCVVDLVESLKNNTGMTLEQALTAISAAKDAVEAAVNLVETAHDSLNELVQTVIVLTTEAGQLLVASYENTLATLQTLGESLAERPAAMVARIQAETEAAIAYVKENYAAELAVLQAVLDEIDAEIAVHVAEKKAELEAQYGPEIEQLKQELANKELELSELLAKIDADVAAEVEKLTAEIEAEIAELQAQLTELHNQYAAAAEDVKAEIEAKIAELEAHIAQKQEELVAIYETVKAQVLALHAEAIAVVKQAVADLQAHIAEKEAELLAALEVASAEVAAQYAVTKEETIAKMTELNGHMDAEIAALETVAADGAKLLQAHVEAVRAIVITGATGFDNMVTSEFVSLKTSVEAAQNLANTIAKEISAQVEILTKVWENAYVDAITDGYISDEESYYVALGDYSGVSESYVDIVADELKVPYKNLSVNGMTAAQLGQIVSANAAEIQKADLITLGFGSKTFIEFTAEQVKASMLPGAAPVDLDWSVLLNETGVALVEQALAELNNYFLDALGAEFATVAPLMTLAVESYAYSYLTHAAAYASAIFAIHSMNPEAQVILVGMHNPMEDLTVVMGDSKVELGEYLEYLVDLTNAYSLGYAMLVHKTIYVDAPNVEVANTEKVMDMEQFIAMLMMDLNQFNPTAAGQQYVADQILDALTVHTHNYIYGKCACGKLNPETTMFRIFGETRVETAFSIANELKLVKGISKYDTILVAAARNYPDALAGSYMAIEMDAPILLVENNAASVAKVTEYISQNLKAGGKVYILGGEAAVTTEMDAALTTAGIASERVAGANRVETNLEILKKAGYNANQKILVCNARNYADSLAASATGLPILLVEKSLTAAQKAFLATTSKQFVIAGGNLAVSETVEAELKAIGSVTRLAGADRMETSVMVAGLTSNPRTAVMAYSHDFPDGLCGGPLAHAVDGVILLINDSKYAAADNYVDGGHNTGLILGGTARIADGTARDVFDIADLAITPREAK